MKIYLPSYSSTNCAYVSASDTIRVYERVPTTNSTVNYTDYFVNSHYLSRTGSTTFNQYSTIPVCLSSSDITNNVFYRNDIDSILVIFMILLIFCFYFPYRIISRMFGRWLKL